MPNHLQVSDFGATIVSFGAQPRRSTHLKDAVSDGGNIVAPVGFASNVEVAPCMLWMRGQELPHEFQHIVRHAVFVMDRVLAAAAVREARVDGLIDIDHVVRPVPTPHALRQRQVFLQIIGAVFEQNAHLGRAARATVGPQNQRVSGALRAALEEEIEHSGVHRARQLEVTGCVVRR